MLTIRQAINLLLTNLDAPGIVNKKNLRDAQKLGIEALKRVLDIRRFPVPLGWKPLPGEADEEKLPA